MVAATLGPAACTNSTASFVVMCSSTTRRRGCAASSGASTAPKNTGSRSKMSTSAAVTSPCTHSSMPTSAMRASAAAQRATSVTPASEFVVAPAGYSLAATTPAARAAEISSGEVLSVRYSVMSGVKSLPGGSAAKMRSRYASASAVVRTGGLRFGMMIARAIVRGMCARSDAMFAPSRRWRCQSSGRGRRSGYAPAMVRKRRVFVRARASATAPSPT